MSINYYLGGGITDKKEIATDDKTIKALYKKALGFKVNEKVEEFSLDKDGKMVLSKKKVSQKYIPPDTVALKTLFEMLGGGGENLTEMTEVELKSEKDRLIKELLDIQKSGKNR